jgi:hypothetical protein
METNQLKAVFDNYFEVKKCFSETDGSLHLQKAKEFVSAPVKWKL